MIPQCPAKIFLADDRGHSEMAWFRSYNTFNFGKYNNEHKAAFGSLYVLNDDTLAGGKNLKLSIEENSHVILIPIVGAVAYTDSNGNESLLQAGEAQLCSLQQGTSITITNPYEKETINFLQVWIKNNDSLPSGEIHQTAFDLNNNNQLILLFKGCNDTQLSIGKYDGRAEDIYKLSKQGNSVFAFVIEGAFEVQNRLLHARDGLALWELQEVEFEALSNEAIILFVECN
jgi:quercetin 2,3-dioxygenase